VDKAEQNKESAFAVNASGRDSRSGFRKTEVDPGTFRVGLCLDGLKENGLYTEDDAVNPLNEYGKSKLTGEQQVAQECERYLILRLSWVFGAGKQNFIYNSLNGQKNSEYLKIACDEFSVPTYTDTVVDVTLKAIEQG